MVEPVARLVCQRAPEFAAGPVAGGAAAEERHVDADVRQVDVRDLFLSVKQLFHVIVVDQQHAFGADDFDARAVAERRIVRRQRRAHVAAHQRAVVQRHHGVGDIVAVVAGFADHALLPARQHFAHRVARQPPVDEVDEIRERIHHRRGMRVALQLCEHLRARVVDAQRNAGDPPQPPLHHLLLGQQVAPLEAAAVAHVQAAR